MGEAEVEWTRLRRRPWSLFRNCWVFLHFVRQRRGSPDTVRVVDRHRSAQRLDPLDRSDVQIWHEPPTIDREILRRPNEPSDDPDL